jgi:hypothetical protein
MEMILAGILLLILLIFALIGMAAGLVCLIIREDEKQQEMINIQRNKTIHNNNGTLSN